MVVVVVWGWGNSLAGAASKLTTSKFHIRIAITFGNPYLSRCCSTINRIEVMWQYWYRVIWSKCWQLDHPKSAKPYLSPNKKSDGVLMHCSHWLQKEMPVMFCERGEVLNYHSLLSLYYWIGPSTMALRKSEKVRLCLHKRASVVTVSRTFSRSQSITR